MIPIVRYRLTPLLGWLPLVLAGCLAATPARSSVRPSVHVPASSAPASAGATTAAAAAGQFVRDELYFGTTRRDRNTVTDAEWTEFLRDIITPRFPDGLTVLTGRGQYRMEDGSLVVEGTHLLVVLYENTPESRAKRERAIDEIMRLYKERFEQESVLRVTALVNVRF